ncbi:hypothetical protein KIW84_024619 [Lathyrus oleraceus]|uniref:Uncharacterized protein n=1 Tax=Pisum sativum TaxID=3888 RepID=A0A9D4YG30_PEA|nr:hypothetical protein KIW84_024619 [Pisum sativum]
MAFFIIFFNAFASTDVIVIITHITAHYHFYRDLFKISSSLIFPRRSWVCTSAITTPIHINVSLRNPRKRFKDSMRLRWFDFGHAAKKSLGEASYKLKHLSETKKSYLVSSPLWLFQLFLNSTFEPKLHVTVSPTIIAQNDARAIEGTKLALITPQETPLHRIFMKYIDLFLELTVFTSTMSPFVDCLVGPSWFRFPCVSPLAAAMSNLVWATFLTPTLSSTRIDTGTPGYGFVSYRNQNNLALFNFNLVHFMFGKRTFVGRNED